MTPADVLRAAKARIATPERWTQGTFARDRDGGAVDMKTEREEAVCWCSLGAIEYACDPDEAVSARAMCLLMEAIGEDSIEDWNDHPRRTHAEVLAAFDRAIAIAEAS